MSIDPLELEPPIMTSQMELTAPTSFLDVRVLTPEEREALAADIFESPPPRLPWFNRVVRLIRRLLCSHRATLASRVPGMQPPVYVRHCMRCDAIWPERG